VIFSDIELSRLTPFGAVKNGASAVSSQRVTARIRLEIPPEDGHSFFGSDDYSRVSENGRPACFHVIQLTALEKFQGQENKTQKQYLFISSRH
jgi:hypothetical protein